MKRVLILYLMLFNFLPIFSQDFVKEYEKKTLIIDSLQKQVIKPLNDSIIKLSSDHKSEISKFQEQIGILEDDTIDLHKEIRNRNHKIAELNKNKVKIDRDNLRVEVKSLSESVSRLKAIISQRDTQIEEEKQLCERKAIEKKENGRMEALHQIIQTYNKPFDELIIFSTLSSVERDLSIVSSNNGTRLKLLDLQKYFLAKQVLSEKYNENTVKSALAQIGSLAQTESVKNLTNLLSKYKLRNDGLKSTIDKILKLDDQMVANDDHSQDMKQGLILSNFAWYFRNYRFNFTDYPYLSDIILEIMKQKERDANADVSHFLDEL